MDIFVLILELLGTVAFAVSGAMTALRKKMDIFGVCILGLTAAVGGGVIRDVLLGLFPPAMFENPVYACVAIGTSVLIFIPGVRRRLMGNHMLYDRLLFFADSCGLGIFTVNGVAVARAVSDNLFLAVFVGAVTGVGGGLLRDILAGNTPYIFRKDVYACAGIAGAVLCALLRTPAGETVSVVSGISLIVLIRILAAHFRWSLPRAGETPPG